ncbi:MAG: zinc ribbon domain-containing protein [Ruminiclostridium sp.]|nr:zinc ribbon domain-containing protein [Ruminiclostridium sp.]
MADSKVFNLSDGLDAEKVGRAVEVFLRDKKKLTTEGVKTPEGFFVQAKEESDGWKKIAGMSLATQVQLIESGSTLTVNIGNGKWSDKAGAAALGMVLFAPLAVTAAIGAANQKKLPQEIFDCIEKFILSGGKSAVVSMGMSMGLKDNQVLCPKCKTPNDKSEKFCSSCGTPLSNKCPKCHASVALGKKFCSECGSPMEAAPEEGVTCPKCGASVPAGKKFCSECGTAIVTDKACPNCGATVPGGKKFCPECGSPMDGIKKCSKCGAEIPVGQKFCDECGTKVE